MSFLSRTRILLAASIAITSSLIPISNARAGLLSASGNTYVVRDGQQFYYSSDVGSQRITGTIRGNYNGAGYFNGRFTDYSTNGEGCTGDFSQGKLQPDGTLEIIFNVDRAAANHRCTSTGQRFLIEVEPTTRNAFDAMLWASSPNERIAIYNDAGSRTPLKSYGIRGDRVTLIERFPKQNRLKVSFASGVSGWVNTSNVIYDN